VASEEINYRRFFDINDLAAIRVELPEVFEHTHRLLFRLLADGQITGLRIDHRMVCGIHQVTFAGFRRTICALGTHPTLDRNQYEQQQQLPEGLSAWLEQETGRAGSRCWPLYVVAEKILSEGETLPSDWAIHGTTGYDFLNDVNGLFVDGNNDRTFDKVYRDFVGSSIDFKSLINSTKKMIMLVAMVGEMNALAHQLDRISEKNRWYRDFTLNSLTFALREVIACLPIYRTYVSQQRLPSEQEKTYIRRAVAEARRRNPRTARAIFDFIEQTLLLNNLQDFHEKDRHALLDFVMKVQQITGPVTAKGVEDTAFYIFNRLVSLNEVGGNPAKFWSVCRTVSSKEHPAPSQLAPFPAATSTMIRNVAKMCEHASTCCRKCQESGSPLSNAGPGSMLQRRLQCTAQRRPIPMMSICSIKL
jgi:(1->4)-alpha-D-glucan 1-alpha-D-glucosylmutase